MMIREGDHPATAGLPPDWPRRIQIPPCGGASCWHQVDTPPAYDPAPRLAARLSRDRCTLGSRVGWGKPDLDNGLIVRENLELLLSYMLQHFLTHDARPGKQEEIE